MLSLGVKFKQRVSSIWNAITVVWVDEDTCTVANLKFLGTEGWRSETFVSCNHCQHQTGSTRISPFDKVTNDLYTKTDSPCEGTVYRQSNSAWAI